jgi:hypothetical protein
VKRRMRGNTCKGRTGILSEAQGTGGSDWGKKRKYHKVAKASQTQNSQTRKY